jgi:hypothetical protein
MTARTPGPVNRAVDSSVDRRTHLARLLAGFRDS